MDLLYDLRDPRTTIGKIFLTVVSLLLVSLVLVLAISGFVLSGVLWPSRSSAGVNLDDLISRPEIVSFVGPGGQTQEGWLFPGLRTAPVIVLCHGFRGQRSDLLTLVTPLQEHRYNVFVFDFAGHGSNDGSTSLGPAEAAVVQAAIEELSRRDDLDGARFGVWGTDIGGYAALVAATTEPRIKALAVDSIYDRPEDFLALQVERSGLASVPLVGTFTRWGYYLTNWSTRNDPPLSSRLASLNQTPKLFIQGRDTPALADATLQLFLQSPEPRAQAVFPRTAYAVLSDTEKREYETQVLNFFLQHLPTFAVPASAQGPGN